MNKYLVVKNRGTDYPNPVKVLKGEIIECLEKSNENGDWKGWIFCKTTNNEGWIPEQIIDQNNDRGTILENYDATEFNLEIGEILVKEKILNGWIWGYKELDPQKKGWAPLNHIESESVKDLWNSYLSKNFEVNPNTRYTSWYFCDNKKSADELVKLVLNGEKKGTTSLNEAYEPNEEKPKVNDYSVITDFEGEAKCIIKIIEIKKLPFNEVTKEMAYLEGEGDKSLEYWRRVHTNFFGKYYSSVGKNFNNKALVIYEHFELVHKNNN